MHKQPYANGRRERKRSREDGRRKKERNCKTDPLEDHRSILWSKQPWYFVGEIMRLLEVTFLELKAGEPVLSHVQYGP